MSSTSLISPGICLLGAAVVSAGGIAATAGAAVIYRHYAAKREEKAPDLEKGSPAQQKTSECSNVKQSRQAAINKPTSASFQSVENETDRRKALGNKQHDKEYQKHRSERDASFQKACDDILQRLDRQQKNLEALSSDIDAAYEASSKKMAESKKQMYSEIEAIIDKHRPALAAETLKLSESDPNTIGNIHYIRHTHSFDFSDMCPELENTARDTVALSQQGTLDLLLHHKAEIVLPESHTQEDDPDSQLIAKMGTEMWFSDYVPGQELDERQKQALHDFGAHRVYKYLPRKNVKHVIFHASSTEPIQRKASATAKDWLGKYDAATGEPKPEYRRRFASEADFMQQRDRDTATYLKNIITARNNACIDGIKEAMHTYPGKDVFVIMGASENHNIPELLRKEDPAIKMQEHDTTHVYAR